MPIDIIPREAWGAAPPTHDLTPVTWPSGVTLWLHHTVTATIDPEPGGPPRDHEERVWVGKSAPNMRTLALRHPGKALEIRHAGDGRFVVVHIVGKRQAQLAIWLAQVTRTKAAERRAMREIQAFHQRGRGWSDIGYWVICFRSGRVYEGRGQYVAAHCPGHNTEPSVALAGDYTTMLPTDRQHVAVALLKAHIAAGRLKGHRDGFPTSCPGDAAYHAFGLDK